MAMPAGSGCPAEEGSSGSSRSFVSAAASDEDDNLFAHLGELPSGLGASALSLELGSPSGLEVSGRSLAFELRQVLEASARRKWGR